MSIERLELCLNDSEGGRFRVLYGMGIEDSFFYDRFEELDVEEAIQRGLHMRGYDVVFTSPHRPLYFLDEQSKRSIIPRQVEIINKTKKPDDDRRSNKCSNGPFEDLRVLKNGAITEARSTAYDAMGDVHSIRLLDSLMKRNGSAKTAIVFMQAESALNYFEDPRILAGILGEWLRLPSSNENLCFFLFSAGTYAELCQAAETLPVPELRSLIFRKRSKVDSFGSLFHITGAHRAELMHAVRFLQHRHAIQVDEDCIERLAERINIEGGRLNTWLKRLQLLKIIHNDSIRSSGWFQFIKDEAGGVMQCLDRMVGLKEIKQRMHELRAWYIYRKRMAYHHINDDTSAPLHHLVFTGNPGTGKTTVARLMGDIYRELGVLRRGHVVEVKGSDLIAEHVGGTAIKTNQVIDQAIDGILFIDEAYVLSERDRGGFGREAVDALLTRMEDDRHRLVVIIAGYPRKIQALLDSNPGLPRRFPRENIFEFPDYSAQELSEILKGFLSARHIPTDHYMDLLLTRLIHLMSCERDEYFGNAGEMRNLADAIERKRAFRLVKHHLQLDTCLAAQDLPERYIHYIFNNEAKMIVPFADQQETGKRCFALPATSINS